MTQLTITCVECGDVTTTTRGAWHRCMRATPAGYVCSDPCASAAACAALDAGVTFAPVDPSKPDLIPIYEMRRIAGPDEFETSPHVYGDSDAEIFDQLDENNTCTDPGGHVWLRDRCVHCGGRP